MQTDRNFRGPWVWHAIIVAASPILGYGIAFLNEWGFCSVFGIPTQFIRLNLTTILSAAAAVLAVAAILSIVFGPIIALLRSRTGPLAQSLARLTYLFVAFLGLLIIYRDVWLYWLVFLCCLLVYALIEFSWPLITQRGKGSYVQKLKASQVAEGEYGSVIQDAGRFPPATIVAVIWGILLVALFSFSLGQSNAMHKTSFLVPSAFEDSVVLRIYDDNMICATIDNEAKEVESNFFVLNVSGEPTTMLKLEKVGPLKLKKP